MKLKNSSNKLLTYICLLLLTAACGDNYCITNSPGEDVAPDASIVNANNAQVYANGASPGVVLCNQAPCINTARVVQGQTGLPTNNCTSTACDSWTDGPSISLPTNNTEGVSPILIKVAGTVNLCANDPNAPPSCPALTCPQTVVCCITGMTTDCTVPTICPEEQPNCNTDQMCQYGKPYPIVASSQQWQNVSNANPGDTIQLTAPPPNANCPNDTNCYTDGSVCSCVQSTDSNKYSWSYAQHQNIPGINTPIYPASGSFSVVGAVSAQNDLKSQFNLPGWSVSGAGLMMYIGSGPNLGTDWYHATYFLLGQPTPPTPPISPPSLFSTNDGNATVQGVIFLPVLGDKTTKDTPPLPSYANRITVQTLKIGGTQANLNVAMMYQDMENSYYDNIGGGQIYVIRRCVATNGVSQSPYYPYGNLIAQVTASNSTTQTLLLGDPLKNCESMDTNNPLYAYCDSKDISSGKAAYYYIANPTLPNNQTSGQIQYKVHVNDSNSSGSLAVTTYTQSAVGHFSAMISDAISTIQKTLSTTTQQIFSNMTHNINYIAYTRLLLTLYVLLYGLFFLLGVVQISQMDLVMRVIKIGVIVAITSPDSWNFFNNNLFDLFVNGGSDIISIFTSAAITQGSGVTQSNAFGFVDNIFAVIFFDYRTWLRILSLILTTPLGFVYVLLMLWGIVNYFVAVMEAVIVYIMSLLTVQILLVLSPIFIPFILFGVTRHLFNNWLQFLFAFALKPVLLLIGLSILSSMLFILVLELFSFPVCFGCAIPIFIWPIDEVLKAIESVVGNLGNFFFCIPWVKPWGFSQVADGSTLGQTLGWEISSILLFVLITTFMKKMPAFVDDMTERLSGTRNISLQVGAGGTTAQEIMNSLKDTTLSVVGMDKASKDRRKGNADQKGPTSPKSDIGVKARNG